MIGIISNCNNKIFNNNLYLLTNCDELIKYVLINTTFNEYAALFLPSLLNQFLIKVELDSDKTFFDVQLDNKKQTNFMNFVKQPSDTIDDLRSTINMNGYAIVDTIMPLLSFMSYYNPNYNYKKYRQDHLLLVIGYDKNNYYYVEHPALLNENCKLYSENNDIGYINKFEFEDILIKRMNIFTISFNASFTIEAANNYIFTMLKDYLQDYYKESSGNIYWGQNAIEELIIYYENKINPDTPSKPFPYRTLGNILPWRFSTIRNSRQLAKIWLENNKNLYYKKDYTNLIDCINQSYEFWAQITNIVFKCKYKKDPIYIKEPLQKVKEFENETVKLLAKVFN